jgi:DNA-binding transcriptional LysR family regulator
LLGYAESIESTLHMACEQVSGSGVALSGHVRMGCTEGFGSFFITPQLSHFTDAYPAISVDILPLPHFISLSKREADIVIALERPEHGPYVCCKLCDYRLRLYATREYLDQHPADQRRPTDFATHSFHQLRRRPGLQLRAALPQQTCSPALSAHLRSTSVIAQYVAAQQGQSTWRSCRASSPPRIHDCCRCCRDRGGHHAAVLDVLPRGPAQAQADHPVVGLHPRRPPSRIRRFCWARPR